MRQGWLGAFVLLAACGSEAGPSDAALPDGGADDGRDRGPQADVGGGRRVDDDPLERSQVRPFGQAGRTGVSAWHVGHRNRQFDFG